MTQIKPEPEVINKEENPGPHNAESTDSAGATSSKQAGTGPRSSTGWDGKLRVDKRAVLANPEALSDPEYSDEDAPKVEQIAADEDLLDDWPLDEEDIDLVHRGIVSIPALKLDRFTKVKRLLLRQNQISNIDLPSSLSPTLEELDLYDNLISHLRGLDNLTSLTSLDLSFNKLKHIKNLSSLAGSLRELFLVQNRISRIENLEQLSRLRNLELGANRIRTIENLEAVAPSLEELWLGRNKIAELSGLAALSNLRILSLPANRLTSLGAGALAGLAALEELYVSHNAIAEIADDDLRANTALRVLDISANKVTKLNGLATLRSLEDFWASDNQLASFQELEEQLADKKDLETIYLEGNPLQRLNEVLYRNKVRLALPQVKQIDATFVQPS